MKTLNIDLLPLVHCGGAGIQARGLERNIQPQGAFTLEPRRRALAGKWTVLLRAIYTGRDHPLFHPLDQVLPVLVPWKIFVSGDQHGTQPRPKKTGLVSSAVGFL